MIDIKGQQPTYEGLKQGKGVIVNYLAKLVAYL